MPQEPAFSIYILTARQLYDFAVSNIKGMHFGFATAGEHEHEARLLDDRMKSSKTVPGTHQLHSFIPISANTVEVKSFSNSTCSRTEKVAVAEVVNTLPFRDIRDYVTVAYAGLDMFLMLTHPYVLSQ